MGKSPEMQQFLDQINQICFGHSRSESQANQVCTICGGAADSFKDEVSRREYTISGMCQTCQDGVFTTE